MTQTPLAAWIGAATRRLKPKGMASFIQSAERLPELLSAMAAHLGSLVLQPVCPREGREANLVILQGRKTGRGAFRLLTPVVLHDGPEHLADGDDYSAHVSEVLREGAPLLPAR